MTVLYALADIEVVGEGQIAHLKQLAWSSPNKRSRICLSELKDGVQEMVIALSKESYVRPHRHPSHKSESYHLLDGEMMVRIFQEDGKLKEEIKLTKHTRFYRMKNGWFHQPVSITPFAVYHEVLQGPHHKEIDVQYADWSSPETV
jgi:cupin fold WbuC family metalloprotein